MRSAIAEIAEVGVDGLVTSKLAQRAQVARSSVYNHFEDRDDLFAEIWLHEGRGWLDRLASAEHFGAELEGEARDLDLALLEIFATAHRFAELGSLVRDATARWWQELSGDEVEQLLALWRIGIRLGVELSLPVTPGIVAATKTNVLVEAVRTVPEAAWRDVVGSSEMRLVADPFVAFQTEEERLLLAAIKVIADHGVENASIARIARRAGVTKGSVYPRFADAGSIVSSGFALSLERVVDANTGQLITSGITPETTTAVALNALRPERRVWRDFRTELHIAARYDRALAEQMAHAFETTRLALAVVAANYTPDADAVYALTQAMQATSVGWPVLFANGASIENANYPRLLAGLAAGVAQRVGS